LFGLNVDRAENRTKVFEVKNNSIDEQFDLNVNLNTNQEPKVNAFKGKIGQ
jgi:hypothetical protein